MAKVTSKLQVTVPKALAQQFGIRPGSEISGIAGQDAIRIVPVQLRPRPLNGATRLGLFDEATTRQHARRVARPSRAAKMRGWSREDFTNAHALVDHGHLLGDPGAS